MRASGNRPCYLEAVKSLTIILSAGVLVGLVVYGILQACGALGLVPGDLMTIRIAAFVGTLASVGFGSAGLALLFRRGMAHADEQLIRRLEERIERLETGRGAGGAQ